MKDRGYNRDPQQCRVKIKELRQAYQKTREANGRSGSEPQTCHFYDELHAILGGEATTTPPLCFDSINGLSVNRDVHFGDEDDDSAQQASRETVFPESQELFLTLDLEPVPPEPTQGGLLDPPGREGTSGHGAVSDAPPEDSRGPVTLAPYTLREELQEFLEDIRGSRNKVQLTLQRWGDFHQILRATRTLMGEGKRTGKQATTAYQWVRLFRDSLLTYQVSMDVEGEHFRSAMAPATDKMHRGTIVSIVTSESKS
ncbi:hypothetical protein UY3_01634 [Chelonia mydas]|uniref:Myb/SANT-like DNA-binding domain-containing protein n=1 Tax=Chelonia mydas TaxID=8469 RepID=M7BVA0_CHEMY|nr:hypothetical protein UY3_01634 [Chelonia mydas]